MGRTRGLAALAVLALLALGLWWWHGHATRSDRQGAASSASPAVPVTVGQVKRQDEPVTLSAIGTIQAYNSVAVHSRVDGELTQLRFREGQDVQAGEVLAQIDPRTFQATLDQALAKKAQDQALLLNAQRDLRRNAQLVKHGNATWQQYDTSSAQVAQLQAAVLADDAAIESSRVQLGYTTIIAPISGRVGIRNVDAGNIIHASDATAIVTITQVHPIALLFSLPEPRLTEVVEAMAAGPLAVTARSADGSRVLDEGRLELVDNRIDESSGTVRLKAIMPNAHGLLWPGQFVTVGLRLRVEPHALTVPSTAVQPGADGPFAYVVGNDGTVAPRKLVIERTEGETAVVARGLAEGETVVTDGQSRLKPGARVERQTAQGGGPP